MKQMIKQAIYKRFIHFFIPLLILYPFYSYGFNQRKINQQWNHCINKKDISFYKSSSIIDLFQCIGLDNLEHLENLKNYRINPNELVTGGQTFLHETIDYGIDTGDFTYAKFLLMSGSSDPSIADRTGEKPLDTKGISANELADLKRITISYPFGCDLNVQKLTDEVEEIKYFNGVSSEEEGIFSEGDFSLKQTEDIIRSSQKLIEEQAKVATLTAYFRARNNCLQAGFHECGSSISLSDLKRHYYDHYSIFDGCKTRAIKRGVHGDFLYSNITLSIMGNCRILGEKNKTLSDIEVKNIRCEKINSCRVKDPSNQNFKKTYIYYNCGNRSFGEVTSDYWNSFISLF